MRNLQLTTKSKMLAGALTSEQFIQFKSLRVRQFWILTHSNVVVGLLHGHQGQEPLYGHHWDFLTATVGQLSSILLSKQKGEISFHKCPLVATNKSYIFINSWGWIKKCDNWEAHLKTESLF